MSVTHGRSSLKSKKNKTTHMGNDYNDNFKIFFSIKITERTIYMMIRLCPAIKVRQDTY
jgi:hypothetical protein